MRSNALIAYNVSDLTNMTNAITGVQKKETRRQNLQIISQLKLETEENDLENPKVFKATSKNAAKPWKMGQKTCIITRAGKLAKAAIKQIITQKF